MNDDPAQLLVQKRLLGRFAATVWEFSSPDEVVSQAQKYGSCPNLVSDFHMPGMNGMELARIWCELHGNARVLLVSASNLSVDEEKEALFLPNNHVKLLSSFSLNELIATAKEWFVGESDDLQGILEPYHYPQCCDLTYVRPLFRLGLHHFNVKVFKGIHKCLPSFFSIVKFKVMHFNNKSRLTKGTDNFISK